MTYKILTVFGISSKFKFYYSITHIDTCTLYNITYNIDMKTLTKVQLIRSTAKIHLSMQTMRSTLLRELSSSWFDHDKGDFVWRNSTRLLPGEVMLKWTLRFLQKYVPDSTELQRKFSPTLHYRWIAHLYLEQQKEDSNFSYNTFNEKQTTTWNWQKEWQKKCFKLSAVKFPKCDLSVHCTINSMHFKIINSYSVVAECN